MQGFEQIKSIHLCSLITCKEALNVHWGFNEFSLTVVWWTFPQHCGEIFNCLTPVYSTNLFLNCTLTEGEDKNISQGSVWWLRTVSLRNECLTKIQPFFPCPSEPLEAYVSISNAVLAKGDRPAPSASGRDSLTPASGQRKSGVQGLRLSDSLLSLAGLYLEVFPPCLETAAEAQTSLQKALRTLLLNQMTELHGCCNLLSIKNKTREHSGAWWWF